MCGPVRHFDQNAGQANVDVRAVGLKIIGLCVTLILTGDRRRVGTDAVVGALGSDACLTSFGPVNGRTVDRTRGIWIFDEFIMIENVILQSTLGFKF